ncbi:MAG: aminomethyl-transferring glycine dehydrogenase subunit GcvPA, partial [bacterium]|nr:aminomethyl-transferring glycine dehydrogenase subunit GcvPA [bacterium]
MSFIANTPDDVARMLEAIGVDDIEDLFAPIPRHVRLAEPPGPARGLSEYEVLRLARERARRNRAAAVHYLSFIGAGAYEHFIPAAVQAIARRGELLTAYTPYQPEASQGTLQIIYEFQSMICALTGLEVANASMYDGASALAEAILMAVRITDRRQALLPETLHPRWREVARTITAGLGIELLDYPARAVGNGGAGAVTDPAAAAWPAAADDVAAVVIAQPNFWGCLEPAAELTARAHDHGALAIAAVNPMSLAVLEPPGEWGADAAVGEAQPLGLPLSYGGPYAGFFATRAEHVRRMPGRLVGRTRDARGRDGFVLTLQTREQHIRRERATSNICTNEGLCAAMVTVWLALVGKEGFVHLGRLNLDRAARLREALLRLPGVEPFSNAPFFNEFTRRQRHH